MEAYQCSRNIEHSNEEQDDMRKVFKLLHFGNNSFVLHESQGNILNKKHILVTSKRGIFIC